MKKVEKWQIIMPLIIALISGFFNLFQYLDSKKSANRLNAYKAQQDSLQYHIDSIKLNKENMSMLEYYPIFQVEYYHLFSLDYLSIKGRDEDIINNKNLKGHTLATSKYVTNEVSKFIESDEDGEILVLAVKQVGGSKAENVSIIMDEYEVKSLKSHEVQYTYQEYITNMLDGIEGVKEKELMLGELSPSESIIIPLFFSINRFELMYHSVHGKIYIPKAIKYNSLDGKTHKYEVRGVLATSFEVRGWIEAKG